MPLLIALLMLAAALAFFFLGRGSTHEPTVRRRPDDDVNHAELEQAEREVQEAEDEDSVRDWGPGTGKP